MNIVDKCIYDFEQGKVNVDKDKDPIGFFVHTTIFIETWVFLIREWVYHSYLEEPTKEEELGNMVNRIIQQGIDFDVWLLGISLEIVELGEKIKEIVPEVVFFIQKGLFFVLECYNILFKSDLDQEQRLRKITKVLKQHETIQDDNMFILRFFSKFPVNYTVTYKGEEHGTQDR